LAKATGQHVGTEEQELRNLSPAAVRIHGEFLSTHRDKRLLTQFDGVGVEGVTQLDFVIRCAG
jgi:hypothetical protein